MLLCIFALCVLSNKNSNFPPEQCLHVVWMLSKYDFSFTLVDTVEKLHSFPQGVGLTHLSWLEIFYFY